jgi:hypothetical protein
MCRTEEREAGTYPTFDCKQEDPEALAIKMTRFHNLLARMLELIDDLKVVSLVRHPCGAIYSWLTTPSEFPRESDPMEQWRTGECRKTGPGEFWGFEDWKTVTRLHMELERRFPDRFRILQYETLVNHPNREARRLFSFFGLAYTEQTSRFLRSSHQRHHDDPYAVFKEPGVKDRWIVELDSAIREAILEDVGETELRRFLV